MVHFYTAAVPNTTVFELPAIAWTLCTNPLLHDRAAHIEQLNPALVAKAGTHTLME